LPFGAGDCRILFRFLSAKNAMARLINAIAATSPTNNPAVWGASLVWFVGVTEGEVVGVTAEVVGVGVGFDVGVVVGVEEGVGDDVSMNAAVMVMLRVKVMIRELAVPVASPLQLLKLQPDAAVALKVTLVPAGYSWFAGETVPCP
jgi:hypothetical protein